MRGGEEVVNGVNSGIGKRNQLQMGMGELTSRVSTVSIFNQNIKKEALCTWIAFTWYKENPSMTTEKISRGLHIVAACLKTPEV